ncbi:hypothetical protein HanRHA438_Chr17g0839591 [Helianthus annuus]|nr:hypothetical protein HanRHA438_Chr17g0839591 [Helianthus annuus]
MAIETLNMPFILVPRPISLILISGVSAAVTPTTTTSPKTIPTTPVRLAPITRFLVYKLLTPSTSFRTRLRFGFREKQTILSSLV